MNLTGQVHIYNNIEQSRNSLKFVKEELPNSC